MSKKVIIVLLLVTVLFAGCVDKQKASPIGEVITPPPYKVTPTLTVALPTATPPPTVLPTTTLINKSNTTKLTADAEWCKSGAIKKIDGKDFTMKGLTSINNTVLCYAVYEVGNTKATYYFSKDGSIRSMNSSSMSKSGNASASANARTSKS